MSMFDYVTITSMSMSKSRSERAVVAIRSPLYGAGHEEPISRVFPLVSFRSCDRMRHVSYGG